LRVGKRSSSLKIHGKEEILLPQIGNQNWFLFYGRRMKNRKEEIMNDK